MLQLSSKSFKSIRFLRFLSFTKMQHSTASIWQGHFQHRIRGWRRFMTKPWSRCSPASLHRVEVMVSKVPVSWARSWQMQQKVEVWRRWRNSWNEERTFKRSTTSWGRLPFSLQPAEVITKLWSYFWSGEQRLMRKADLNRLPFTGYF